MTGWRIARRAVRVALVAVALAAGSAGAPAQAALTASYTGTLPADDPDATVIFTVDVIRDGVRLIAETLGYAGGTNAEGVAIAPGGFDPVLALYDATGALLTFDDDSGRLDPVSGFRFDALLNEPVDAGRYFVAVSTYANFPTGPLLGGYAGGGSFTDLLGNVRTSAYAVDIAVTPIPAALPLLAAGLAGLAVLARRQRRGAAR
jgi:hypothetical protein